MARLAVTGAAGFVGSHFSELLISHGHEVVGIDNFITGMPDNLVTLRKQKGFEFFEADVVEQFPDVGPLQGIFHLACPASPADFERFALQILRVCSNGTFNVVEAALKREAWLLLASTSEFYGDPQVHPQHENYLGNVNPNGVRGVYDEGKRFSEAVVSAYVRLHGLKASTVRIFNTYGPRMRLDDGRVVSNFIVQALRNDPLTIYGSGSQTRSLCYVKDLVAGLYQFWLKQPTMPINLGSDQEISISHIAALVRELSGSTSDPVYQPLPADDPKMRRPDLHLAKTILAWQPTVSLKDGLSQTITAFRNKL